MPASGDFVHQVLQYRLTQAWYEFKYKESRLEVDIQINDTNNTKIWNLINNVRI